MPQSLITPPAVSTPRARRGTAAVVAAYIKDLAALSVTAARAA